MDKAYDHKRYEEKVYKKWEESGAFKASGKGKDYTILMPPPNANASLHAGHAMYTVDDTVLRFKRMQGYSATWIPGLDHAGFETQFVYEKHLAKQGKSRFDFDRQSLYEDILSFVKENSGLIVSQMKKMGFSADWNKSVFTLDEHVVKTVYETFMKMHKEGLVYRDEYIVNYCTHDGTSLAELEVKYVERKDPLYYIKYGAFVLATVRPETKFGDTAVAVNPKDKRYKEWIGKEIEVEGLLGKIKLKVIEDPHVDPKFGTGVVKVTPGHDPNDFEMGKRHNLEVKCVIDVRGKLNHFAGPYEGMKVMAAREQVAKDLEARGLMEKVDREYVHSVATCYKCGRDLEPMVVPNWFINVDSLKKPVINAIKKNETTFTPKRHKKQILDWLAVMHDWPISRQIVWGIRIPVWYPIGKAAITVSFISKSGEREHGNVHELLKKYDLSEIKAGLQSLVASVGTPFVVSVDSPGEDYLPETDTFDTWFSSGQWPIVTNPPAYPTDFMGTYSDILKFWVSRMMMFGIYLKNDVPFRDVYLWSMVADKNGLKMSKSKGNVVDPMELVEKYGADALRMSLMFGVASGSKIIFSEDKVRGMRNFANKVWNIARFVAQDRKIQDTNNKIQINNDDDRWILEELEKTTKTVTRALERYRFNTASEYLYEFIWHKFADVYIEKIKSRKADAQPTLELVLEQSLKLLHPFMPFVTEAIWEEIGMTKQQGLLIRSAWPLQEVKNTK